MCAWAGSMNCVTVCPFSLSSTNQPTSRDTRTLGQELTDHQVSIQLVTICSQTATGFDRFWWVQISMASKRENHFRFEKSTQKTWMATCNRLDGLMMVISCLVPRVNRASWGRKPIIISYWLNLPVCLDELGCKGMVIMLILAFCSILCRLPVGGCLAR